ncbi:hypothetical protein [Bradyrhizobium sp. CCBAU 11361]|nr:hypothetical protein [Bradyrhizobium sp. CCBAU 11361]
MAASINDREAASKIEALAADDERRVAALAASKEPTPVKGADES